jgi:hypothetical protein
MDSDEREICNYLKSRPTEFVGLREISRRAGGKWRYREDPHWADEVVTRLLEKGIIEKDGFGHFRAIKKEKKEKPRWISPQMKKILEKSGKTFDLENEEEEEERE